MKLLATIVFAASTLASGVAGAAQYNSDAERRDQNRTEALANWRAAHSSLASTPASTRSDGRPTLRERGREGAKSVRNFTHRQAEKARNFSERQDRRYGKKRTTVETSPEGGGK